MEIYKTIGFIILNDKESRAVEIKNEWIYVKEDLTKHRIIRCMVSISFVMHHDTLVRNESRKQSFALDLTRR